MALGARATDVVRMVVRKGMALGVTGLAIGLVAALAANRVVGALLFDVTPTDTVTYAAVSPIVLTVAALAAYIPARRASRVDPLTALRE
jgi:ABC-type antimicrobial peptide transport system permease subunit